MKVYTCPYDPKPVEVPAKDAWSGMLGGYEERGISGSKVLTIDALTGKKTTYAEAHKLALQLAHGLRVTAGLKAGDVVGIWSPNSTLYPILTQGAQAAGVIPSLANPTYTSRELLHQLNDSQVNLLFTTSDLYEPAMQAAKEAGIPAERVYALPGLDGKVKAGARSWETLVQSGKQWKHQPIPKDKLATTTAFLPYSSGTTGLPKGVVITHENIVAMSAMLKKLPYNMFHPNDIMLAFLPFFHIYGLTSTLNHIIFTGSTVIVMPRFDMELFLNSVQKYRATMTVPPVALGLARHPAVAKADLSSLKKMVCGAAPLSGALQKEAMEKTKAVILQGWGMTETSCTSFLNKLDDSNRLGSCGVLIPGQLARLVDEDGKDVPEGKEGELWVKGPNIIRQYHRNEKATQSTVTPDGWLKTGDVAIFDKDGFMRIVDRTKELIKYKGFQVAPAELEALLLQCDLVADSAVIGVYSEADATELPRAYIVPSEKGKKTSNIEKEVVDFIAKHAAPHKQLRGGVKVLEVIPKS